MERRFPSLPIRQERALVSLLEEPSVEAAAAKAGVSRTTLWRWTQEQAFRSAYEDARREMTSQALDDLNRATCQAVETLRSVMRDTQASASARVAAAKVVLDSALTVRLEELEQRLRELEESRDARS
jgi:hypothetical protein